MTIKPAALGHLATTWQRHADHFPCELSNTRSFAEVRPGEPEIFTAMTISQLLRPVPEASALSATIAADLATKLRGVHRVHFFKDQSRLPADADCTAVAYLTVLHIGSDHLADAHRALDFIAANTNDDGVVTTYFDPTGERAGIVDPVVCMNVVRLACRLNRGNDVRRSWDYVCHVLETHAYVGGTRYYPSEDCFLNVVSLGLEELPWPPPYAILRDAIAARIGTTTFILDLAQRALAARNAGISNEPDRELLRTLAGPDGTWAPEGWFSYGRSRTYFGSRALSTAFAVSALASA